MQRRLDEAMRELDAVKRQNRDLQRMALEIREARHVVAQEMKGDKVPEEVRMAVCFYQKRAYLSYMRLIQLGTFEMVDFNITHY